MEMNKLNDINSKALKTNRIEVRGKTLVFDNSIYQITNISSIEVGSSTKPIPRYFWLLLVACVGALYLENSNWSLIAIFVTSGAFLIYWINRKVHGMLIRMNSGYTKIILSRDFGLLKSVATGLQAIMDDESKDGSITFNLDQRTMMDHVSGSVIALKDVAGDIVNEYKKELGEK